MAVVDLFQPATYEAGVPHPTFDELRRTGPVVRCPESPIEAAGTVRSAGPGYHAVLSHAEVRHVSQHPELFSAAEGTTNIRDPKSLEELRLLRQMLINMDPPRHTQFRLVVNRSFTPR